MKYFFCFFTLAFILESPAQKAELRVPFGHGRRPITCIDFSPDGQMIMTGGMDQTVKLWDLEGHELQEFSGYKNGIFSAGFSSDGQRILIGDEFGNVNLCDVSGEAVMKINDNGPYFSNGGAAFSPNSKLIVVGDSILDLSSNQKEKAHFARGGSGTTIEITKDSNFIIFSNAIYNTRTKVDLDILIPTRMYSRKPIIVYSPKNKFFLIGGGEPTSPFLLEQFSLSGEKIKRMVGERSQVSSLAVSPDESVFVSGHYDGTITLWDSNKKIKSFKAHRGYVSAIAFSPNGQMIISGSGDGSVKLWDQSGNLIRQFEEAAEIIDTRFGLALDGRKFYFGTDTSRNGKFRHFYAWDFSERQVLSKDTMNLKGPSILSFDRKFWLTQIENGQECILNDYMGNNRILTFRSASRIISFGISYEKRYLVTLSVDNQIIVRDFDGKIILDFQPPWNDEIILDQYRGFPGLPKKKKDRVVPKNYLTCVSISKDGQYLAVGGIKALSIWDIKGNLLKTKVENSWQDEMIPVNMSISPDNQLILIERRLRDSHIVSTKPPIFWSWQDSLSIYGYVHGHTVTNWRGSMFAPNQGHTSLYVDQDSAIIRGKRDEEKIRLKSTIRFQDGIFSDDGRFLVFATSNGSLKIYKREGKHLANLYLLGDGDWAAVTPEGLFDASPNAMSRMYYIQELEAIELEQLKERYYEPGLMAKIMGYTDEMIRKVEPLGELPLYPKAEVAIDQGSLHIHLRERNGGIGKVSFFVNHKEVINDANPSRQTDISIDLKAFTKYYLPGEKNQISLRVYNAEDWLRSSEIELTYSPDMSLNKGNEQANTSATTPGQASTAQPGGQNVNLYVIAIGTSDYKGTKLDLKYAGKDAVVIADALAQVGKQLFNDRVHINVLSTDLKDEAGQPSKSNIQALFTAVKAKAQADDILLVYLSGHGTNIGDEKANFYYLTKDISDEDWKGNSISKTSREKYAISDEELTQWINQIPALKQVLVVDACNSGTVVDNILGNKKAAMLNSSQIIAFERMKDRTGMYILAGSAADKVSLESWIVEQGLLTYSLLAGMDKEAVQPDGRIDIMQLFQNSRNTVPKLAKQIRGIQTPELAFPKGGASFDIGIRNDNVRIRVTQIKPIFVSNDFQDEDAFADQLKLTDKMNQHLTDLVATNSNAKLHYIPTAAKDENTFYITGRYKQSGDLIRVRARLYKGDSPKGDINLDGKKDELDKLVERIVRQALQLAQ